MSLPRYPKYKDSGVEWLGEVPEHWQVKPLKYMASLKGRLGWQGLRSDEYTDDGPFLVTSEHLSNDKVDWNRCYHVLQDRYELAPEIQLREGDLLMMKDGAAMGKLGFIDELPGPACLNSHLLLFRPLAGAFENRFLYFVLGGPGFNCFMVQERTGTTFFGISQESIGSFPLATPPQSEQHKILRFLNRETAKIDELVEEQRRLIELLKEKRQAVISHAVTKGLNLDAPMKDSGIDWLGEIPTHWDLKKFNHISTVVRGGSPRPAGDERYFNGDFTPWITVGDLTRDAEMYLTSTESMLTEDGSKLSRVIPDGTLVLSNSGATLGVPKILSLTGCANDGVLAFLSLDPCSSKQFLYYYLTSLTENLRDRVRQGSGQPNLNTDIIKALPVPWPSNAEQTAIAQYLESEALKFDKLATEANYAIDLLQERRTALISAAVTGKIDVRGLSTGEAA